MLSVRRLHELPAEIPEFIGEIAAGFVPLYGARSADHYRRHALAVWTANLRHPAVRVWAAFDGPAAAGLLMGVLRETLAEISFMHVLEPCRGQGVEEALVRAAVGEFRGTGASRIISDWVPFAPLDLQPAFERLGFEHLPRQVMCASTACPGLAEPDEVSEPIQDHQWPDVARCLVQTYRGVPWAYLHPEVENLRSAAEYLERLAGDGYGRTQPSYCRAVWREGQCAGTILGTEMTPDTGFVLQAAVAPPWQGRRLGTGLLRGLAAAFRAGGLPRVTLGVTAANPARRLYARLGFETNCHTGAYVWRAAGEPRP
jgi:ribosomal protein S18 acetylase RimI-like enzyme